MIHINGCRVVRKIGIVDAVAGDRIALRQFSNLFQIFEQTISEHRGLFRQFGFIDAPWQSIIAIEVRFLNGEVDQLAGNGTVVKRVQFAGANTDVFAEGLILGKHRGLPAAKIPSQCLPQSAVQGREFTTFKQTPTIGRIGHNQAMTGEVVAKIKQVLIRKTDLVGETRPCRIFARRVEHPSIDVKTQHRLQARHTLLSSVVCFRQQARPHGAAVLFPSQKTIEPTRKTRGNVGCHHGRFNHQRTGPTHGVHKRFVRLRHFWPACTQQ